MKTGDSVEHRVKEQTRQDVANRAIVRLGRHDPLGIQRQVWNSVSAVVWERIEDQVRDGLLRLIRFRAYRVNWRMEGGE